MPERLKELDRILDPEAIPFESNRLRGESVPPPDNIEAALCVYARSLTRMRPTSSF